MTAGNEFDPEVAEPTLFSALLTPHRSLNRTGFLVLMAFLSLISFAAGVAFLLMGAWPVFGFFGLDVLAIYWAFKINFRRARACEEILVTPSELRVLLAIVKVGGAPEVAEALGVAENTVKFHLKHLFEKTGTGRQADLVKLVAGFANPLAR